MKASLFWQIFGPSAEDEETLELVGSSGRLRLVRDTGEIDLVTDYGAEHRVQDARGPHFDSTHFGADVALLHEIRRHYDGDRPVAGTSDGYESLRMVEATQDAIDAGGTVISLGDGPATAAGAAAAGASRGGGGNGAPRKENRR